MAILEPIVYEQPINEHVRACLRLEHLFNQFSYWLRGQSIWDTRSALAALIEILNVLDRPDIKAKFVKELGRYGTALAKFADTPHIDSGKLAAIRHEIDHTLHQLHAMQGRIAQTLRDNDFLTSVRTHLVNPGGGCSFDVPAFHCWLQTPLAERTAQLTFWLGQLKSIRLAVELTLRLIRQSSAPELREAPEGFYQAPLDPTAPCQLIRVITPHGIGAYPEISVGRHGISIRFYTLNLTERPSQTKEDVKFQLTCCVF